MPIVNRQTSVLFVNLNDGTNNSVQDFSFNFNLDFDPTAVIVRQIVYADTGFGTDNVLSVLTNWTNSQNGIIATFIDTKPFVSNPDSQFKVENPGSLSNGDVSFQVRRLSDTITANTGIGRLSLTLEFIREVYPEPSASVSQMSQLIQTLTDMTRPTDIYPFDNIDETKSQPARVETPEPTGRIADLQALEERQEGGQDEKKVDDITVKTKPRPI